MRYKDRPGHGHRPVPAASPASRVSGFPAANRGERALQTGCAHHRIQLRHTHNLRVRRWLAARPRFHVHFTPTHASRLNQVEILASKIFSTVHSNEPTQQVKYRWTYAKHHAILTPVYGRYPGAVRSRSGEPACPAAGHPVDGLSSRLPQSGGFACRRPPPPLFSEVRSPLATRRSPPNQP